MQHCVAWKDHFIEHLRAHSGGKLYQCEVCNYRWANGGWGYLMGVGSKFLLLSLQTSNKSQAISIIFWYSKKLTHTGFRPFWKISIFRVKVGGGGVLPIRHPKNKGVWNTWKTLSDLHNHWYHFYTDVVGSYIQFFPVQGHPLFVKFASFLS